MSKNRAILALIALVLAGCSAAGALSTPAGILVEDPTGTAAASPEGTASVVPTPWDQALVDLAKEQLSQRLGVPAGEIEVESVRSVRWPDASLGCAIEPDTFEQQPTAGFVIVLSTQGERYTYHTDFGEMAVLCQMPVPPEAEAVIKQAKQDLAQRLQISPSEIQVVTAESITWSDSSLGCPEPGRTYMQVVTPGYFLLLEAEGEAFEYHTDQEETVVLCEQGMPAPPKGADNPLVAEARQDLSTRLSVSVEAINVVSVELVTWPDAGLGCPQPGMKYPQVPVDGILIQLEYAGKTYDYHGGGNRKPFLCEQAPPSKSTPPQLDPDLSTPPSMDG